jgi:hypothetical protein
MYEVGDMVKLKSRCTIEDKVMEGDDYLMGGCWHGGGPVVRVFRDRSFLIRDRPGNKGTYVIRATAGYITRV